MFTTKFDAESMNLLHQAILEPRAATGIFADNLEEKGHPNAPFFQLASAAGPSCWQEIFFPHIDRIINPPKENFPAMRLSIPHVETMAERAEKIKNIKLPQKLAALHLGNNYLGGAGPEWLRALPKFPEGLLAFYWGTNNIANTDFNSTENISLIQTPDTVQMMHLGNNSIGFGEHGLAEVQSIKIPRDLIALHLGGQYLGLVPNGIKKIQTLPKGLLALHLGINHIGLDMMDDGVKQLEALPLEGMLALELGRNYIGVGENDLRKVQALPLPETLLALDIGYNEIGVGSRRIEKITALAGKPCTGLLAIELGDVAPDIFWQGLRAAYQATIADGTLPSIFHLQQVASKGNQCAIPQAILALRDQAAASWQKAHTPRQEVEIASGAQQEETRHV